MPLNMSLILTCSGKLHQPGWRQPEILSRIRFARSVLAGGLAQRICDAKGRSDGDFDWLARARHLVDQFLRLPERS